MSEVQVEIEIQELPKGRDSWIYKPTRISRFLIKRRESSEFDVVRVTVLDPLELRVGDVIRFDSLGDIPPPLRELAKETSAHPAYAIMTKRSSGDSSIVYVGDDKE